MNPRTRNTLGLICAGILLVALMFWTYQSFPKSSFTTWNRDTGISINECKSAGNLLNSRFRVPLWGISLSLCIAFGIYLPMIRDYTSQLNNRHWTFVAILGALTGGVVSIPFYLLSNCYPDGQVKNDWQSFFTSKITLSTPGLILGALGAFISPLYPNLNSLQVLGAGGVGFLLPYWLVMGMVFLEYNFRDWMLKPTDVDLGIKTKIKAKGMTKKEALAAAKKMKKTQADFKPKRKDFKPIDNSGYTDFDHLPD